MNKNTIKSDLYIVMKSFERIQQNQPWLIPLGIITSLVSALYPFINIYMSALIVDKLIYRNWNELLTLALITIGLNLVFGVLINGLTHLKSIQEKMFYNKQKQITSNKAMELDYESLASASIHEKIRRMDDMHEVTGMRLETFAKIIIRLTQSVTRVVIAIILVTSCFTATATTYTDNEFMRIMASPIVSIIFVLFIVLIITANTCLSLKHGKIYFQFEEDSLPLNKMTWYYDREYLDTYRTGKEIRIFEQSEIINKSYNETINNNTALCNRLGKLQGRYNGFTALTAALSSGAIYLYVSLKALAGIFSVGSIVRYVGAIRQLCDGVEVVFMDIVGLKQLFRWLHLYWDFMNTENVNYKGTLPVEKRNDNEYEFEFKNVWFKYPGTDKFVLKNLNLNINIGQRMAVVGMNGSGKTTMIKLLCRLYEPTEGKIMLNGINIKKYNLDEYMSIFSVVFQDFKLFAFTLGQNVATSREYDMEKASYILSMCGLANRINELDKGLDTYIYNNFGEAGVEISGGEAQKIALARALYKDAPFIVLDEPTAALDPIAEFEIYSKFNEIVGKKTAIYISHRLSSCRFCDDIAVFHEGELIQRGNHNTLIADTKGKYQEMWSAQAQYYEEIKSTNHRKIKAI